MKPDRPGPEPRDGHRAALDATTQGLRGEVEVVRRLGDGHQETRVHAALRVTR